MEKKRVLFHTDFSLRKTGFAKHAKLLLKYLYNTNKYELLNYCCDTAEVDPDLSRTPWKSVGAIYGSQHEVDRYLSQFPPDQKDFRWRRLMYGEANLNKVISEFKPDVYFGIQDIWGVDFSTEKDWFTKINSVIWTTLDSLPILPGAVSLAPKIKNYWIWADFATKALNQMGFGHVKTVRGAVDDSNFFPIPRELKLQLRNRFNIPEDAFVIGFVFRNQLRKSLPNLLAGYKLFKQQNPNSKTYLLLHTHFCEGWNIMQRVIEHGIDPKEILTTYVCQHCRGYEVRQFTGENGYQPSPQSPDCRYCSEKGSLCTTNVRIGVTEEQLNQVYNLMDVYCHPFTSGGQEIPIQEAKLAGLVTCVTNYSCGEDNCVPEAHSLPLSWAEYREPGTEFIKATTYPESIAARIGEVYRMSREERLKRGLLAREWALKTFSVDTVGSQVEAFIDACPKITYNFDIDTPSKNPDAKIPDIKDDLQWLITLYRDILKMNVDEKDAGVLNWMENLRRNVPRSHIEQYFRNVAKDENNKIRRDLLESFLDADDKGKRILLVIPESIGDVFLCTALLEDLKETYPNFNLYVATKRENFEVLACNPFIHKTIDYIPEMDSLLWLEGMGSHKGFFEIAFLPYVGTQRFIDYPHNGIDKITINCHG